MEFPLETIGDELVVYAVTKDETKAVGVQPGMKVLDIEGAPVGDLPVDKLILAFGRLPVKACDITFAIRRGNWWKDARQMKCELSPPFGFDIPYCDAEACSIVKVNGMEAQNKGVKNGMKILHIVQGHGVSAKEIWATDLSGGDLIKAIKSLNKDLPCTMTFAEWGTHPDHSPGKPAAAATETRAKSGSITM